MQQGQVKAENWNYLCLYRKILRWHAGCMHAPTLTPTSNPPSRHLCWGPCSESFLSLSSTPSSRPTGYETRRNRHVLLDYHLAKHMTQLLLLPPCLHQQLLTYQSGGTLSSCAPNFIHLSLAVESTNTAVDSCLLLFPHELLQRQRWPQFSMRRGSSADLSVYFTLLSM